MQNYLSKKSKALAVAVACSAALCAGSASAANLTFDGFENGYQSVNVTSPVHNGVAGGFKMKDTETMDSFVVFCLDILAQISGGQTYSYAETDNPYSNSFMSAGGVDRIQKIFDAGYDTAFDSSVASAGFQVALWNAVYDTDWDVTNTDSVFYQTDTASGVQASANNFLSLAENYDGGRKWRMTFLESQETPTRSQNLVTVSAVPVPAAGLMLLTVIGAGAFAGRRKNKAAK